MLESGFYAHQAPILRYHLKIPLLKTISGQKAYLYRGAKVWNGLEIQTKQAASLKTFKDQLKTGSVLVLFLFYFT